MNDGVYQKINEFFSAYKTRSFKAGHVFAHAGEELPGVIHLEEGIVEQYDISPEGNRISLNNFKPPAFFPMSWALNQTENQYFFEALTDVKVKIAEADKVVDLLKDNPDITFDLITRVYKGTDGLLKRLALSLNGHASARLIYELLLECYRFGKLTESGIYKISVKHGKLAERSGLARETVSRELRKLVEQNCLVINKDYLLVDTERLERIINNS